MSVVQDKKFEFTGKSKEVDGTIVYQIKAIKDIDTDEIELTYGKLGGWLEHEGNLSHNGLCWLDESCVIMGNSVVKNNIFIENHSIISGNSVLMGDGCVQDSVIHDTKVFGDCLCVESIRVNNCVLNGMVELVHGDIENCEIKQKGKYSLSLINCVIENKNNPLIIENLDKERLLLENIYLSFVTDKNTTPLRVIRSNGYLKELFGRNVHNLFLRTYLRVEHLHLNDCSFVTHPEKQKDEYVTITGTPENRVEIKEGTVSIQSSMIKGDGIVISGNVFLTEVIMNDFSSIQNLAHVPIVLKDAKLIDCSQIKRIRNVNKHLNHVKLCHDELLTI